VIRPADLVLEGRTQGSTPPRIVPLTGTVPLTAEQPISILSDDATSQLLRNVDPSAASSLRKYKAKNFIDTAVYRTGDATSGSAHALLSLFGVATSGIAWVGAAVAAVWALLAYRLGNTHERNTESVDEKSAPVR
jgi:AAA family ATP:ADP antiporter